MPTVIRPLANGKATPPYGDPCALLAAAQQAMYLLVSGGQTTVIETPALGRVEFSAGSVGDLQRLIDNLTRQCAQANGLTNYPHRRILSIEACP